MDRAVRSLRMRIERLNAGIKSVGPGAEREERVQLLSEAAADLHDLLRRRWQTGGYPEDDGTKVAQPDGGVGQKKLAICMVSLQELNDPLSAISLYVAGVRRHLEAQAGFPDGLLDALNKAEQQVKRADEMARGIRALIAEYRALEVAQMRHGPT